MNCLKQRTILALSQMGLNLPQKHLGLLLKSESWPTEGSVLEQSSHGINRTKKKQLK